MTRQKIIGIPAYKTSENGFGAGVNHLEFMSKFGNPRIIMPHEEFVKVDLLYLPGGADLSPSLYNQIPGFATGNPDVFKEFFFRERLKNYVGNTPIYGVCLGMQMLNVYFNGQLVQDLKFHEQSGGRWSTAHKVYPFDPSNPKSFKNGFKVNSHHHQCVTISTLSPEFDILAITENDDILNEPFIIEAIRHKSLPIAGVQFHSEELYDEFSINLVKSLIPQEDVQN